MKLSDETLCKMLMDADDAVPAGRRMRHIGTGDTYFVRGHSLRECDLEVLVQYSKTFGPAVIWSRPLREIQERFLLSNGEDWPCYHNVKEAAQ